jgi:hypothetical protein
VVEDLNGGVWFEQQKLQDLESNNGSQQMHPWFTSVKQEILLRDSKGKASSMLYTYKR